jgi:hypothetical protein
MRRRVLFVVLAGLAGLVTAACAPAPTSTPPPTAPPTGTAAPTTGTGAPQPPPPASEPTDPPGVEYRITYDWGVPGTEASITHPLTVPLPGPIGLPYLVGVYVGDHPEANPKYQRISFYYRLAFPSYRFQYVPQVVSDGSGEPVPLPGNAFLNIVFVDAQAHDDNGASTIAAKPRSRATSRGTSPSASASRSPRAATRPYRSGPGSSRSRTGRAGSSTWCTSTCRTADPFSRELVTTSPLRGRRKG